MKGRPKKENSETEYEKVLGKLRELEAKQEAIAKQIYVFTAKRDQMERNLCSA